MDAVLIQKLAKQLSANPLTRSRVLYAGTGRVNLPALRAEIARMEFAEEGARSMDSHTPSRNAKGRGGPKGRSPASGERAKDHPNFEWAGDSPAPDTRNPPTWWAVSKR